MFRPLWLATLLGLIVSSVGLLAPMKSTAADDSLEAAILALTDQPLYSQAHWGLLAVDLESGDEVLSHQPTKLFAPASVTKLFSTASALHYLGSDHQIRTPIVARGKLASDGTFTGDLILRAMGDFHLGGRVRDDGVIDYTSSDHTYANWASDATLTPQDPLAGINQLAAQVHAFGIRKIIGEVLIDDTLFDHTTSSGSGPSRVTPIFVNDNVVDLIITPGEVGTPATVEWRPKLSLINVQAKATTSAADEKLAITISSDSTGNTVIRGTIPAGRTPLLRHVEVTSPAGFARSLLIEALARQGIAVDAKPSLAHPAAKFPTAEEYQLMTPIAELVSSKLSESTKLILKVSHNLHASTLPLLVATAKGERTLADGMKLEGAFLKLAGVDADSISFGGGAGGSQADYVTPRATVQLLKHMHSRDDAQQYRASLPILGVDGTLAKSVDPTSPARGKVHAKTGTLVWDNQLSGDGLLTSKGLAGYITTTKGRTLAFAFFVNGVHLREGVEAKQVGNDLARICEMIHAAR